MLGHGTTITEVLPQDIGVFHALLSHILWLSPGHIRLIFVYGVEAIGPSTLEVLSGDVHVAVEPGDYAFRLYLYT